MKFTIPILVVVFLSSCKTNVSKDGVIISDKLMQHVAALAHDSMQGRLTGTIGEEMAAEYIVQEFTNMGLAKAPGVTSFKQSFQFYAPFSLGEGNSLKINNKAYAVNKSWYPVPVSGNGKVAGTITKVGYGIESAENAHWDYDTTKSYEESILMIDLASPDGHHPHSAFKAYNSWRKRVEMALEKRPVAILLFHAEESLNIDDLRQYQNVQREIIPIVYLEDSLAEQVENGDTMQLEVDLQRPEKTGHNILAYIDNNAEKTVVIGAHYDHLGHGEYGNSRAPNSTDIHNGADDNASGVAVVLELARSLNAMPEAQRSNYLFMAFSGEELGLLGSSSFVKTKVFDAFNVSYMLNFDMVGRMKTDSAAQLIITGTGTSPVWDSMLKQFPPQNLKVNTNAAGLGSSDHSSFYLQEVPAIHFFTGTHADYHKPSDDVDKLNVEGMERVHGYAFNLLKELDDDHNLPFTKTEDANESRKSRSYKVTLGIMPGYASTDEGMLVEAVSEGKPASKAGMQKGDIIIQMDHFPIKDVMAYVEALGNYSKGDEVSLKVKRDGEVITLQATF